MRQLRPTLKPVAVLAATACIMAVTAASAFATVSIEPLSTKFSGSAAGGATWQLGGESIVSSCTGATLTGTTNATKTNNFNATDAFSGCTAVFASVKRKQEFTNSCAKEGTIPWTVTFAEGGSGTVKLNCALVVKLGVSGCTMTAPAQTAEHGLSWANVKSVNLELLFGNLVLKSVTVNEGCEEFGIGGPTTISLHSESLLINGIHAA